MGMRNTCCLPTMLSSLKTSHLIITTNRRCIIFSLHFMGNWHPSCVSSSPDPSPSRLPHTATGEQRRSLGGRITSRFYFLHSTSQSFPAFFKAITYSFYKNILK